MLSVRIRYYLSEAGKKASLLAGGDGSATQELEVPPDSPRFKHAVALANFTGDVPEVVVPSYEKMFDEPATADQILDWKLGKIAAEQEAERQRDEKRRAETQAVLDERRTRKTVLRSLDGTEFDLAEPAWPYQMDESVAGSAEARAWTAELLAENEAVRLRCGELDAAENARRVAAKELAKQNEQARREALGLAEDDDDFTCAEGALLQVPVWQEHKRGKNWMAKIAIDPKAPGGLARSFADKGKGRFYYIVPSDLQPGDPLEFGADYYSGGGRKSAERWYGFVVRIDAERLILRKCKTSSQAIKDGAAFAASLAPDPLVTEAITRVNSEGGIVNGDN